MNNSLNDIRNRISQKKAELNLSYQDMAEKTGLSKSTLQRYITGDIRNLGLDKLEILAKALEVSPSYLMGWEDENNEPILENIPGIITPVKMKKIPILGTISCGKPIFAEENYDGYFMIDKNLPKADFVLKAKGDSMIEANIYEGDFVFFRKQNDVDNGTIAAVLIDDEATLKRVSKSNDMLILQPCNKNYEPIIVSKQDHKNILILGEMVGVYSKRCR
ncbi:LexA family protein [Peptoniphilus sp. SGI.035]|uniref:LexA family protein n=1 Tax=Peptoniphilus sp. SGI.035 TaxID=3420564 RepID=UPI003D0751F5